MSQTAHIDDPSTVVLVHGRFADGSSWNGVIERPQAKGVKVTAPANPLRGISSDSAYIASVLDQIPGPVVAVGHSYGGAVITNAASVAKNVVGLVYVAASPKWDFDDATYERTAASFDNADHVDIVIHNYRWRLSLADGERQYDELEARLFEGPVITVPTTTIGSDFDGANADGHAYAQRFSGPDSHRVLDGIGHNVPQEAPEAFADAILEVGGAK
jgi:pimeloyl-ACP methyl ester carboxylesterase